MGDAWGKRVGSHLFLEPCPDVGVGADQVPEGAEGGSADLGGLVGQGNAKAGT